MMAHYLPPDQSIWGTDSETACGKKAWRCNWTQHFDSVTCKECRAAVSQIGTAPPPTEM